MTPSPYPETGPLAVLARALLMTALLCILVASIAPAKLAPRLIDALPGGHFVVFFVLANIAAAAAQRRALLNVWIWLCVFAALSESAGLLTAAYRNHPWRHLTADACGSAVALYSVSLGQFRRRFAPIAKVAQAKMPAGAAASGAPDREAAAGGSHPAILSAAVPPVTVQTFPVPSTSVPTTSVSTESVSGN